MSLRSIAYGDVTGDGVEEAMVVLSVGVTGGTARPHAVYIFTLEQKRPKVLWAFPTGDRADGGLRQVYAADGDLVVERYNSVGSKGDCCPTTFTRVRYQWQGNHFQQKLVEEMLPHPEGQGSPVMPPHGS